jgi:hypothetical protein
LEELRHKASEKKAVYGSILTPREISRGQSTYAVRGAIFNDFQPIKSQQDIDEFAFFHADCVDDLAKLPVIDQQAGNYEDLRLRYEGELLRLAQLRHQVHALGRLQQVFQCNAEGCADLILPPERNIPPTQIAFYGRIADTNEPCQVAIRGARARKLALIPPSSAAVADTRCALPKV